MKEHFGTTCSLTVLTVLLLSPASLAEESKQPRLAPSENAADERVITTVGMRLDVRELVRFFQRRTWAATHRPELAALVQRLGDPEFTVRERTTTELISAGPPALPLLRAALHDSDPERARRARRCLDALGRYSEPILAESAVRVLTRLSPSDAAAALLEYLPYAADEDVAQTIRRSLEVLLIRQGKAASLVLETVNDSKPARRAVAAYLLGRAESANREYLKRLSADSDTQVRLEAARALAVHGNRSALPILLELLEKGSLALSWRAEAALASVADSTAPAVALQDTPASRRACRTAWEKYWQRHPGDLKLGTPDFSQPMGGRVLVADLDEGLLQLLDRSFKEQWRMKDCQGPVDVQVLPSGRLLIAENHGKCVTERDRWGRIVWQHSCREPPISCWRCPNGNTGIATTERVFEITPNGKEVWAYPVKFSQSFRAVRRLRDGTIAVYSGLGEIVILSAKGKKQDEVRLSKADAGWASMTVLRDGHYLIAGCASPGVVECARDGTKVWNYSESFSEKLTGTTSAARLPDGHTLMCRDDKDKRRVAEIDAAGKTIREHKTEGRPWHVQFLP